MNEILPAKSPAVEHDGQTIDYSQFCCAASELAKRLRELQPDRKKPIAILMDRGASFYTSQFGVLAFGGFFLPIDPANPDERVKFLLDDSQSECVVVDPVTAARIGNWQLDLKVIQIEKSIPTEAPDLATVDPIVIPHADDDPAYMIYTSGSTGKPKGVCIHWAALQNHNRWFIDQYQVNKSDRCLQIASIGFDISIEEIFTTLRSGACLVTINKAALDSPVEFFRWVNEKKLTLLNMPTALWHNVIPALEVATLPSSLRLLIIGGERVNSEMVEAWFKHVSPEQVRLVNGYGPTETTITATVCDLTPQKLQAIGQPIRNLSCHIVSEDGQIIDSPNTPGELYISGVGVAKGYWNRPEQTAKAFLHVESLDGRWCYRTGDKVQRDEEGDLYFLGRVDNQIKLRGYRIELHEIENQIEKHPQVTNAIVRKTESGREQLVCFATVDNDAGADTDALQQDIVGLLQQSLPQYMIPAQFSFLDEFPVTVGGKVDTKKMLASLVQNDHHQATELKNLDQLQTQIVQVWQAVLGNPPPSVDSTFEQCGGDSLAAMALALGLGKQFPNKVFGTATLLTYPTVNRIADYVSQQETGIENDSGDALTPIVNSWGQALAAETPCLIFLHPGGGSGYLYNQLLNEQIKQTHSILVLDSPWLTGQLPENDHKETTQSIARRYADVLASQLVSGTRITTAGYSFGGILAFETARFLMEHGFEIERAINIDQPLPEAVQVGSLPNRLTNWLHRLKTPRLTWYELNYSKEKEALQAGKKTSFGNPQEMLRSFDLEDIHAAIEDAYVPQHCDLQLLLIRGDVIEAKYCVPKDYGWRNYVNDLVAHRVTGTHFALFLGRNLKNLSSTFQSLLTTKN